MTVESTVGERFASERRRLGLGVQEAALACGITRNAINKIERGSSPSGAVLRGFAQAGADVHYVLTGGVRLTPIDLNLLGLSEAALRYAYEQARPGRPAGPARSRMTAMVYNSVVGTLAPDVDEVAALRAAAQRIVEGLDDPADPEMLERNFWAVAPAPSAASSGVHVEGDRNVVAGRDMVRGGRGKGG